MTNALLRSTFVVFAVASAADIVAYLVFIAPGLAVELNPLIVRLDSFNAVASRLALIVFLGLLTTAAEGARHPLVTLTLLSALAIGILVGLIGSLSTIAAAIA